MILHTQLSMVNSKMGAAFTPLCQAEKHSLTQLRKSRLGRQSQGSAKSGDQTLFLFGWQKLFAIKELSY